MSRLASLSTPSRRGSPSPSPDLTRPPPPITTTVRETTHHRMLREVVRSFQALVEQWDELVSIDGLKAGKACIDARTTIQNILQLPEGPDRPPVRETLVVSGKSRVALQDTLSKLDKLLGKMQTLLEAADQLFFDAYQREGATFVLVEPMWMTWTFERFVDNLSPLFSLHSQHLAKLRALSTTIISYSSFDASKLALEQWQDLGRYGERHDEVSDWEELVELEMSWGKAEPAEEKAPTPRSARKKGKA